MKKLKTLEITSSSTIDCYNNMEEGTPTSFEVAKRTVEAINCVRSCPFLVKRIKEEEVYDD